MTSFPCTSNLQQNKSFFGTAVPSIPSSLGRFFVFNANSVPKLSVISYLEPSKSGQALSIIDRIKGSIPIFSLIARLVSDEGGVGNDRIRFPEFYHRVDRQISQEAAEAFEKFHAEHGKVGQKSFVLIWCWAAAFGAGLVKSEDLTTGAKRLRYSFDLEYEVDKLDLNMEESLKRREKAKGTAPDVSLTRRVQKALELTWICSLGSQPVSPQDCALLSTMFQGIFPQADKQIIEDAVAALAARDTLDEHE